MGKKDTLTLLTSLQHELQDKFAVKSLALFGSLARGEERADSDVDLLVEFAHPVGFFTFLALKEFLETALQRKVDLVTHNALRKEFRDEVLKKAVYAG